MHQSSVRELAVKLRNEGYAYPYISQETGLSKSTLSGWLTNIPYTPNAHTLALMGKARAASGERKAQIRQEEAHMIMKEATREVGKLSKRDLFIFGLALYLGEGAKTHNIVRVANSDPKIMRSVVAWFQTLGVTPRQFVARIYMYPDSNPEECLQFWSRTTSIPKAQFQKAYIDVRTDKKPKNKGKNPYGTLHVGVRSRGRKEYGVKFHRKIQAWNDVVLEQINNAGLV